MSKAKWRSSVARRFPALFVNVGHDASYLRVVRPAVEIGLLGSAAYPPLPAALLDPALRVAARLLDPITHQLQLPSASQKPPFKRLPYAAANMDPAALVRDPVERSALVNAVGSVAAAWGATDVIAPYFHAVDPADPAFEASITLAEATIDLLGEDRVVPAVFVDQNALFPQHVDTLLTRITATDFSVLYLLIGVDAPSTAPISSGQLLAGIRLVVEVLGQNDIDVVWGATDGTGLLATTWSPRLSYALGPDTYLRRRRQPTAATRGGYRAALPRVFAKDLLSEIRVPDYQAWARAGRLGCICAACARRGTVDDRRGHYINAHGELTQQIGGAADPAREFAAVVDAAMAEFGAGAAGPSDPDARRHLAHWRAQLP